MGQPILAAAAFQAAQPRDLGPYSHITCMAYTERRLPHFSAVGVPIFVTFRLHGSIPRGRVFRPDILTSNGEAFARPRCAARKSLVW